MVKKPRKSRKKPRKDPQEAVEECLRRVAHPKEKEIFRAFLEDLLKNCSVPPELLEHVPQPAGQPGKTRFDQLYDASSHLAFPSYRDETLRRMLGPDFDQLRDTKIWRVMLPAKFNISHVLIRAANFQEAFALGCDYACRMSLRVHRKIPADLTVRIQFISERAVCRMLDIRWANRLKRRKQLQLVGREFSPKELLGARLVALGRPGTEEHRIFKYAEQKDLIRVLHGSGRTKVSSVETETFRPKKT